MEHSIPFVEKYRPTTLNDVVLNSNNRSIFNNILKQDNFPNILIYGPPGTGKTSTIMALIKEYNNKQNDKNYETMHLNASDDRGVDNIRNIILKFVTTNSLFQNKHKFVILDEVDYMTEQAQLGLKILIETNLENVTFCLICNYISRLDISLCNNFIKIKLKDVEKSDILLLLKNITLKENIECTNKKLENICYMWEYDIRSMINFIQTNNNNIKNIKILVGENYEKIMNTLKKKTLKSGINYLRKISELYMIPLKEILLFLITHMIKENILSKEMFYICKIITHNTLISDYYLVRLFIIKIQSGF
jgi:DNA polymerase III delta prime subunit